MGCNCGKKKVINNLNVPHYVNLAVEIWNSVSNLQFNDITDDQWFDMYQVYNQIFPNSNGQPNKEELLQIIQNATQYQTKIKR
jgi:hypothetical protein